MPRALRRNEHPAAGRFAVNTSGVAPTAGAVPRLLVIDTNIVLDLFVFADTAAQPVREGIAQGTLRWLATQPMRIELERVLGYPKVAVRLAYYRLLAADVMAKFDAHASLVPSPAKAQMTCRDADDQMFIDLAVAHGAALLSKDAAVLALRKRLAAVDVYAGPVLAA